MRRSSICLLCALLSSQVFPTHLSTQETLTELSLAPQNSSLWMPEKASVQPAFWAWLSWEPSMSSFSTFQKGTVLPLSEQFLEVDCLWSWWKTCYLTMSHTSVKGHLDSLPQLQISVPHLRKETRMVSIQSPCLLLSLKNVSQCFTNYNLLSAFLSLANIMFFPGFFKFTAHWPCLVFADHATMN